MSSNRKTNEWNLLKDEFDALVHNEGAHEDNFERFLMREFIVVLAS